MRIWPQKTPTVGLWTALFLLVAICLTSLFFLFRFRQDSRWVQQTNTALLQLDDTFSLLQDAETGQRGYLLTGQARYLKPYLRATGKVPEDLGRLRALIRDNPSQQESLAHLQPLIGAKFAEMQQTIDLGNSQGFQASYPEHSLHCEAQDADRGHIPSPGRAASRRGKAGYGEQGTGYRNGEYKLRGFSL
ncbi:MAG TPA: CHASE3 domain-containing protein [Chthonomonadaceae bacterium]|nr:CHASE3 domain-containing protein [Chthonomonadaceae bacterium]